MTADNNVDITVPFRQATPHLEREVQPSEQSDDLTFAGGAVRSPARRVRGSSRVAVVVTQQTGRVFFG